LGERKPLQIHVKIGDLAMSVIPDKRVEQLQFFKSHNAYHNLVWAADAVAIGPAAALARFSTWRSKR